MDNGFIFPVYFGCGPLRCVFNITDLEIVLIIFRILVPLEYWVLTESRIPLKPVLGGVRIVALSNSFYKQTQ